MKPGYFEKKCAIPGRSYDLAEMLQHKNPALVFHFFSISITLKTTF